MNNTANDAKAMHALVCNNFFAYLKRFGEIEAEVAAVLRKESVVLDSRRRTQLLERDQVCKDIFYIYRGSAFLATVGASKQVVTWISMDNEIITNVESLDNPRAGYIIELVEDSQYLRLPFSVLSDLCKKYSSFSTLTRRLGSHFFGVMQERVNRSQMLTAAEHYAWIREAHPEADRRLPLNVIADYLGINQASLSRLRRQ